MSRPQSTQTISSSTASPSLPYDPLDLAPLHPVARASRVHRPVRSPRGRFHNRLVLMAMEGSHSRAYSIDRVLLEQPKKGVTLFLGTILNTSRCDNHTCPDDLALTSSGLPPVVIKVLPNPDRSRGGHCVDNPWSEIGAMQYLSQRPHHPHVIHLVDSMQDDDFVYLVLPYLDGGDLFSKVEQGGDMGLPEAQVKDYLKQMTEGLLFMKQTGRLSHRDVSLENMMLTGEDDHQSVHIIDLGMCLRVPQVSEEGDGSSSTTTSDETVVHITPQPCRGKPSYLAPEVVYEEPHDPFAADVWSLGVCLYTMLTGRPLYSSPSDQAFKVMARGGVRQVLALYENFGLRVSQVAKDLLCLMLHADPSRRPTLEEVLHSPFLTEEEEEEVVEALPCCGGVEGHVCSSLCTRGEMATSANDGSAMEGAPGTVDGLADQ